MTSTNHAPNGIHGREEFVKELLLEYIQGMTTAEEIRSRVTADEHRYQLLARCTGAGSLPQQLLGAVGLSAYDMEISFSRPAVTTREGLRRNLALLSHGQLSVAAICEWSTDRIAWDIVQGQGCEDDVVEILANEFTHGEDYAQRITSSEVFISLFNWHLDHTSAQESNLVRVGVFIEHWRSSLRTLLMSAPKGTISGSDIGIELGELFHPLREHAPTIVQDFLTALRRLGDQHTAANVEDLITCTTRKGQPVRCVDAIIAGDRMG